MKINVLSDEYIQNLKTTIYSNNEERLEKLCELHNKKLELLRLKSSIEYSEPYIIEFTGTPRAGKTSCANNIKDFFKKSGFRVEMLEEPAGQINDRIKNQEELKRMNEVEFNNLTLQIACDSLSKAKNSDSDIIIMDRGVLDNYIWYDMFYRQNKISFEDYCKYFNVEILKHSGMIDMLISTYINEKEAIKRDFLNSISLEPRRKVNEEKLIEFNISLITTLTRFENLVGNIRNLDTEEISIVDSSITLADNIITGYEKKLKKYK